MIYALHAGLGVAARRGARGVVGPARRVRPAAAGRPREARLRAVRGRRATGCPSSRRCGCPTASTRPPARRTLLDRYGIEVGGGLGEFAGKAWRIGCMGHTARPRNVAAPAGARSTRCSPRDRRASCGRRRRTGDRRDQRRAASWPRTASPTFDELRARARSTSPSGSGTRSCASSASRSSDAVRRRCSTPPTASRGRRGSPAARTNLAARLRRPVGRGRRPTRDRGRLGGRGRRRPHRGPTPSCGARPTRSPRLLDQRGVGPGDAVGIFLPMLPGDGRRACWRSPSSAPSSCRSSPATAPRPSRVRLEDAGAKALVTADGFTGGARSVPMMQTRRRGGRARAIGRTRSSSCPGSGTDVEHVAGRDLLVAPRRPAPTVRHACRSTASTRCSSPTRRARPGGRRASVHVHGGWLVKVAEEGAFQTDLRPGDACSGSPTSAGSWARGRSPPRSPTAPRCALYDGAPDHPGPDRLWAFVARHRRHRPRHQPHARPRADGPRRRRRSRRTTCRRCASSAPPASRGTRIRGAGTSSVVGGGRCPVINISGGTEVGACFLSPHPVQPLKPMSLGGPSLGMAVDVFDDDGSPVRGEVGELVCTQAVAGHDPRACTTTPSATSRRTGRAGPTCGCTATGRRSTRTASGSCTAAATTPSRWRASGSGPAEVETVLVSHPAVVEAAAVGMPDERQGRGALGLRRARARRRRRPTRCGAELADAGRRAARQVVPARRRPVHRRAAEDPQRQGAAPRDPGGRARQRPRRPVVARGPGRPRRRARGALT